MTVIAVSGSAGTDLNAHASRAPGRGWASAGRERRPLPGRERRRGPGRGAAGRAVARGSARVLRQRRPDAPVSVPRHGGSDAV